MMLDSVAQDVRQVVRTLGRAPGAALVIVATLGLAIAASVAIFSVLNASVFANLPYREPERVALLRHAYTDMVGACSPPTFLDYRRESRAFASLSAAMPWSASLTSGGEPERVSGLLVSADFFDTLGVSAWRGRTFLPEEEQPGREHVVLVSHGLWQRRFGGDPALIGKSLRLSGETYEVVGILPPGFSWGRAYERNTQAELWAPFALTPARVAEDERGSEYLDVYARLRPDASYAQAQADLDAVVKGLRSRFPDRYTEASGFRLTAIPLQEAVVGALRPGLWLVFAAVASLLLVAATNVAGLLLARAAGRRRETSVRAALGASRSRLAQQVLAEACVLAAAAGALGLSLARVAVAVLERIDRETLPRCQPIRIDLSVAAFALAVTLFVAIASGLAPAWLAARSDLTPWLRAGLQGGGRGAARARRALIVMQTAVALTLLAGAGLLVRSLAELEKVPIGLRADHVLTAELQLPRARYGERAAPVRFLDGALARLSAQPGTLSVGAVSELPLSGESNSSSFEIEGRPAFPGEKEPHAETWSASPGYFATLGIPLKRGRLFDAGDVEGRAGVAVVSEALARRYYPGEDPIGKRLDFEGDAGAHRWREIVGVVGDVHDRGLDKEPAPQIYAPYAQRPSRGLFLVARVAGEPLAALPGLRESVHEMDAELPAYHVGTMESVASADTRERRATLAALGAFAAAALALCALALYGLVAQLVRERVPEIGLRMALGARRADVVRLFLAEGGRLVGLGLAAGAAGAAATTRLLGGLLFGVSASDPATFASAAALLLAVALAACALPAARAARIDPVRALRAE